MKMNALLKASLFGLVMAFTFQACSDDDDDNNGPPSQPTLTGLVESDARFSILLDALQRTGLDATLDASGTYTVFTPTDDAFADLLAELGLADLDEVEAALGTEGLENILLYHVLGAEVPSGDVSTGYTKTLAANSAGNNLDLYLNASTGVTLNGNRANVSETDLQASNGVAHVIDQVLLPLDIYQLVAVNAQFSQLNSALLLAEGNLDQVLGDDAETYTLFAPTNAAFDSLVARTPGANDLAELVTAIGGTEVLATALLYHVVAGDVRAEDLSIGPVTTAATDGMGANLDFNVNITGSTVTIADLSPGSPDATVTATNLTAVNGSVHIIDEVLVPLP